MKNGILPPSRALTALLLAALLPHIARAGDSPLPQGLASPQPLLLEVQPTPRAVSAAARVGTALVADAGNGVLLLLNRHTGDVARVKGVRVSSDTKIAPGPSGDWYVLNPTARTLFRLSAEGRVLERAEDDLFLRATSDVAYAAWSNEVLISTLIVPSVDSVRRPGVKPYPRFAAKRMGNWILGYGHAVAAPWGRMAFIDMNRQVQLIDSKSKDAATLELPGSASATTLAADAHGRIYAGDGQRIHIFRGTSAKASVEAGALGLSTIDDLRVDEDLLTVTDSRAGKIVTLEIVPSR